MRRRRVPSRPPKEGDRIEIYWDGDEIYYAGKLGPLDPVTKKFHVDYDDGDEEDVNLNEEIWRFVGPNYGEPPRRRMRAKMRKNTQSKIRTSHKRMEIRSRSTTCQSRRCRKAKAESVAELYQCALAYPSTCR